MNILFVTPSIPNRLHRTRSFELIKSLSLHHKVHLVSLTSSVEAKLPSELKACVASFSAVYKARWRSLLDCLFYLFSSTPLEVAYCRSTEMNRLVAKTIEENKIDLVYSKRLRSAQFVIDTKKIEGESRGISNAQSLPIIIDTTDAMSLFYERAYKNAPWHQKSLYLLECIKYKSYEKMIAKTLKRWVVCSPIDSKYLTARLPGVEVVVIPNAIDTEYFNAQSSVHSQIEPHAILLSGLMDKFVNIEAVDFLIKDIYPKIFSRFPDTKVYIVGPDPAAHIKRYASDRVVVTGYVEDIREYLSKAEVIVCPIKTGTGVRNKILQAWAMEKPIVSTSMGIAGLEGTNGRELLVADEAELFADSVCSLFTDKTLRDSLAKNGRVLVEKKYGKKTVDEKLESYIKDFSQSRSPALSDAC